MITVLLLLATACLVGVACVLAWGDRQERLDHERRFAEAEARRQARARGFDDHVATAFTPVAGVDWYALEQDLR